MSENFLESHDEQVNPTVALVLSSFALVLGVGLCCPCAPRPYTSASSKTLRYLHWTALAAFIVATLTFVVYASELRKRDQQDYQGLMRIQGFTLEQREESSGGESSGSSETYRRYYDANLAVEWGWDWACPAQPDRPSVGGCYSRVRPCSTVRTEHFLQCHAHECFFFFCLFCTCIFWLTIILTTTVAHLQQPDMLRATDGGSLPPCPRLCTAVLR